MVSTLKAQGTKAFIWDFSGKMAMHGMGFVVSIFLARLLEPSDFGLIAMAMVIIGIAGIFGDVGLGSALIQRRRVLSIHYSSVFFFNITIGALLTLFTFLAAPLIANFFNNQELIPLTQVISFSFIIGAFSAVQRAKLRKELNYALLTKIAFSSSLVGAVVGISLAFSGAGVWSLVALRLTQGIIFNAIIWIVSYWKPKAEFSLKALRQLWSFGFRMFLSSMLDRIFTHLDTIIIAKLFDPATLGLFNRAKSLNKMVITYSSGSLMSVLFPLLSKVKNDLVRFQNIIKKSLGIIIFVTFLLLGGLYLVSHELIVLLFGEKWLQTVDYFQILVLSGFGYPLSALLVNVLSSRGNSKAFLRLEIYKKLIASVNFVVLYFWGIDAFLYGLVVQATLGVSLNILFASREISVPFFQFAKPILMQMGITIVTVILTLLITQNIELIDIIMFIIKGSVFTLLYFLLNFIIKTSSFEYFLEQIMPIIKQKFGKKVNG